MTLSHVYIELRCKTRNKTKVHLFYNNVDNVIKTTETTIQEKKRNITPRIKVSLSY